MLTEPLLNISLLTLDILSDRLHFLNNSKHPVFLTKRPVGSRVLEPAGRPFEVEIRDIIVPEPLLQTIINLSAFRGVDALLKGKSRFFDLVEMIHLHLCVFTQPVTNFTAVPRSSGAIMPHSSRDRMSDRPCNGDASRSADPIADTHGISLPLQGNLNST